jgi:hypothetical protein
MVKTLENDGFIDPTYQYPTQSYWLKPSTNKANYGMLDHSLNYGGSFTGINMNFTYTMNSVYTQCNTKETASGHIIQYDDTLGRERVLIKHRSGSGLEMRSDGSVLVSSTNKHVLTVAADHSVIVEGDANLVYNGNLNVDVIGDYTMNIGGDYKVDVMGNVQEKLKGRRDTEVESTQTLDLKENYELTVLGNQTATTLGNMTSLIKGNGKNHVNGSSEYFVGGALRITAEDSCSMSSENINIGATDISLFGTTGTIGGDNVIMYTKNLFAQKSVHAETMKATKSIYADETVHAKTMKATKTIYADKSVHAETMEVTDTFIGDLKGTAEKAITADVTNSQEYAENDQGTAAGFSITNTAADETATDSTPANSDETALPTAGIMTAYLNTSDKGIKRVNIDPGDGLRNSIDLSVETDQVIRRVLTTGEVRARLRNPANVQASGFITRQISDGVLSEDYAITIPPGEVGRIVSKDSSVIRGQDIVSTQNAAYGKFVPGPKLYQNIPDPQYIITNSTIITASTRLSNKYTLSKFLSGQGNKVTLNHIVDNAARITIARNLQQQVDAINVFSENLRFMNYRLVITEALYQTGPGESASDIAKKATNGQSVVYQVINDIGEIDLIKTFELAEYWKSFVNFDKCILDYDNYSPDGSLAAQVILVMPEMSATYEASYSNDIETRYNNKTQSSSDFVEIKL